jgi:hypothetical protein
MDTPRLGVFGGSGSGNGGDDDDRKRQKKFFKESRLNPIPYLIRIMEILYQMLYRFYPLFTEALSRFEEHCRTAVNGNILGILSLDLLRILREFSGQLSEFTIRYFEARKMARDELERIRRFIIRNISSSYLDELFVEIEQLVNQAGNLVSLFYTGLVRDILISIANYIGQTPNVLLELIQSL